MESVKFDDTRKALIKEFKSKITSRSWCSREMFLAYAFLRDRSYLGIERTINQDHRCFGRGKFYFLGALAIKITKELDKFFDKSDYTFEYSTATVYSWMKAKYDQESAQAS